MGISYLLGLKSFRMNSNQLRIVSPSIGMCTQLMELDLAHNSIGSLPHEFGALVNLSDLDVSGNLLSQLPESFEINCINMLQLKISYNRLTRIPRLEKSEQRSEKGEIYISLLGNPCYNSWLMEEESKKQRRKEDKIV